MGELQHGGRLDAAIAGFGGARADWLDLSTGINPVAYPVGKIDPGIWQRLPDEGDTAALLKAAREYYSVPDGAMIVPANGTQSIIQALPAMFVKETVAVVSPTYGEHYSVWSNAGHEVSEVPSIEQIGESSVVVVVNPNNPDGRQYTREQLVDIARDLPTRGATLIVDEAFCDCAPELSIIPDLPDNCVVLRSFGKFFGLAGLRLGFAICRRSIGDKLADAFGPWNVSGPALAIGASALADRAWIEQSRQWQQGMCGKLKQLLINRGFEIVGGTDLFVLARHDQSEAIADHLKNRHILVREFDEFPDLLRFGLCKDDDALNRLDTALEEAVEQAS